MATPAAPVKGTAVGLWMCDAVGVPNRPENVTCTRMMWATMSKSTPRSARSCATVMPDARGRGVGAALTVTALRVAPNKPATLFATAAGLPVYRRLGFVAIGRHRDWHPSGSHLEGD